MTENTRKINVRGVYFDNVTMESALASAVSLLERDGFDCIFTPNSEIVQLCIDDKNLYNVINCSNTRQTTARKFFSSAPRPRVTDCPRWASLPPPK